MGEIRVCVGWCWYVVVKNRLVPIILRELLDDISDIEVGEQRRCLDIDLLLRSEARDSIIF